MINNLYKTLNKVETHLITLGDPFDCNGRDVIVCITGNPGVPDFYIEFASVLHDSTGLPVCVIGQSGHEEVPDENSNKLETQEHLFDLQAQIRHKLELIDILDKSSQLHLIGHSIGAWMVLELLDANTNVLERTKSVNLLFPTIQRMAETRNGLFLNNVLRRIHVLVLLLFKFVFILPEAVKLFLIGLYLKAFSLPPHYTGRIMKYLNPKVGEKVLFLAYDEMDRVRELNLGALERVVKAAPARVQVVYGRSDGWAPRSYMDDLRHLQPALDLKEVDFDHSFVLKSSEPVAEMVSAFIKCL